MISSVLNILLRVNFLLTLRSCSSSPYLVQPPSNLHLLLAYATFTRAGLLTDPRGGARSGRIEGNGRVLARANISDRAANHL